MGFLEVFLAGLGVSADAFAVAVCKGLGMGRFSWRHALVIALFFGGFQALMPLAGWALGTQFASLIAPVGHWIAFGLLAFIGVKMIADALKGEKDDECCRQEAEQRLDLKELVLMAVAVSIDALAVGVTFALLEVSIWKAVAVIGVITFVMSFIGVGAGSLFGSRFEKPAAISGGVVLVLIGCKVLAEHLLA